MVLLAQRVAHPHHDDEHQRLHQCPQVIDEPVDDDRPRDRHAERKQQQQQWHEHRHDDHELEQPTRERAGPLGGIKGPIRADHQVDGGKGDSQQQCWHHAGNDLVGGDIKCLLQVWAHGRESRQRDSQKLGVPEIIDFRGRQQTNGFGGGNTRARTAVAICQRVRHQQQQTVQADEYRNHDQRRDASHGRPVAVFVEKRLLFLLVLADFFDVGGGIIFLVEGALARANQRANPPGTSRIPGQRRDQPADRDDQKRNGNQPRDGIVQPKDILKNQMPELHHRRDGIHERVVQSFHIENELPSTEKCTKIPAA